jgi:hypothetical protein
MAQLALVRPKGVVSTGGALHIERQTSVAVSILVGRVWQQQLLLLLLLLLRDAWLQRCG